MRAEQSGSMPPPRQTVMSAIVANAGAAARPSQSAATRAIAAPWLPPPIEIALIAARPLAYLGTSASPAADTLSHCGLTDFSAS